MPIFFASVPNAIPTPYLDIGATDSRYFRQISGGVVNFVPMCDSEGFHGINERLPICDLQRCIHFYTTVIQESGQEFK